MHDIKRTAVSAVKQLLGKFPCVAVIGARQVGKTTFVRQVLPSSPLFDMGKRADYDRISYDPDFFLAQQKGPIIIDESQILPELFSSLRITIDNNRGQNGKYLITGSSSPELLKNITESLAGRVAIYELGGFSLEEQWGCDKSRFYDLIHKGDVGKLEHMKPRFSQKQIMTSCFLGSYPEPFLKFKNDRQGFALWMENYFQTYVKRDVRGLFPGLNIVVFQRFIGMLAASSGQILNYSEYARSLDVSQPTVKSYFEIAHGTFIWRIIQSYQKSLKKRVIKMPKGHMRDTGLLNYLLSMPSVDALYSYPSVGRIWETFVIEQIIKGFSSSLIPVKTCYYRTSNKAEVDLVLEGDFGIIPVEIKMGTSTDRRNLAAIENFIDDYKIKFGIIVNNAEETAWISKKILQVPALCL